MKLGRMQRWQTMKALLSEDNIIGSAFEDLEDPRHTFIRHTIYTWTRKTMLHMLTKSSSRLLPTLPTSTSAEMSHPSHQYKKTSLVTELKWVQSGAGCERVNRLIVVIVAEVVHKAQSPVPAPNG